jgi:5-(carboxyamino)imidazole ribonucleotide synthase
MLALAAARLGIRTHVYCPDPQSPAFDVAAQKTVAAYEDKAALYGFADSVDLVTYEFENVPAETARFLAVHRPLRPDSKALAVAQDRLEEKRFLSALAIPVTPFRPVRMIEELENAVEAIGRPAVLKTTRMGYDGKGQWIVREGDDLLAIFEMMRPLPLVLEAFVPFEREISVVIARSGAGEVAAYDPSENVHRDHILKTSTVPANIWPATALLARGIAERIVAALNYVGVLGVEFFVLPGGKLLVNEIAPRVHNSGHWTEAVCLTDQFEQHIRAICGWPLGDPARSADVVMENLIGDEIDTTLARLRGGARPHLYGKSEIRPGRKMGHINHVSAKTAPK